MRYTDWILPKHSNHNHYNKVAPVSPDMWLSPHRTGGSAAREYSNVLKAFDDTHLTRIVLDLSKCLGADPIPLMAIITELCKQKEDLGEEIEIILPAFTRNDPHNLNFYKGRFLKFLATQGFLKTMCNNFVVRNKHITISEDDIEKYSSYKNELSFLGDAVFPVHYYSCSDDMDRKEIVDEMLQEILFRLKNSVSLQTFNLICEQLYNIVNELVENSMQHAYDKGERKRFCIYIRSRQGLLDEKTDGPNYKRVSEEIIKEKSSSPFSSREINKIFNSSALFLEVFFSDIGIGLTESLKAFFSGQKKSYKYPVRELFLKVFHGMRKSTISAITPFGGLHYICHIVGRCKGFIWCNEGREWVHGYSLDIVNAEKDISFSNNVKGYLVDNRDDNNPHGLNWCIQIPFSDKKRGMKNGYRWKNGLKTNPVFSVYQSRPCAYEVNSTICIDEKRGTVGVYKGRFEEWNEKSISSIDALPSINGNVACIWIPNGNNTKNEICRKIRYYSKRIKTLVNDREAKLSLIIADIETNRFFGYHYVFNELNCESVDVEIFGKVLLISERWSVTCFVEQRGVYFQSRDEEEKYYNNRSESIDKGIDAYARFIRQYDSFVFWNMVKMREKDKIYINASIDWGNRKIEGYLDIERAYLFEDLYLVIENALMRTLGYVDDEGIEFRSVDKTAERVCQHANAIKSTGVDDSIVANVCGASVTGYTMFGRYKEAKPSFGINLFVHPVFEADFFDTVFLLLWPETTFFDSFAKDESRYWRLGKTSLISKKENDALIIQEKKEEGIVRSKKEKYVDFQIKNPRLIRYGHYRSDNHHYLIGFDYYTYLKYSFVYKKGLFVFLLWKILYFLCGESIDEICNCITNEDWSEVVRKCRYSKDSNHGEVVLFHSNTVTEYLMGLIRGIVSPDITKRIIPVSIYEVQPKGSPISFSPFLIEELNRMFWSGEKRGILYVDSSFFTGRRMIEVENILLTTKCKKVTFLSIADMRRLPNGDTKNVSYWKVNVPRLDDDGHCVICETLMKIEEYKKQVLPSKNHRIDEWSRNWSCVNINNSVTSHGIAPVYNICCTVETVANKDGKVQIDDSTTLSTYIAEQICESYSDDFVYNFIQNKTDLNVDIRIQLICTQLLLFGNQKSRQLHLRLLLKLIGLMAKKQECNEYTSLAALVLVSQNSSIFFDLIRFVLYDNRDKSVVETRRAVLDSKNMDLLLSVGFFVKENNSIEKIINGYAKEREEPCPFVEEINELFLPTGDLKLRFKQFEGLYVNELGNPHNKNRQKFIGEDSATLEEFEDRGNLVINDLLTLSELMSLFPIALMNSRGKSVNEKSSIGERIAELQSLIYDRVSEFDTRITCGEKISSFTAGPMIERAVVDCEEIFDAIMRKYYVSSQKETDSCFLDIKDKIEREYGKRIELNISRSSSIEGMKKYYYWNQSIELEFEYLLGNVRHCNIPISSSDDVYMIVNICFELNEILISISSWSEIMALQVEESFMDKNRITKEQARAFDVIFDFEEKETNEKGYYYLVTKMSIPACYQSLREE